MKASLPNPWVVALIVSLATFMEVLDTTITNVSLRHIAGSLGAVQDESTWVLTSYLVANGIVLPLSGWLSDVLGRKRFFIGCIVGFTVASLFCGAATSLKELIFFRILQGAAGGGLQPTQQAIILDLFPVEKRGSVFAITGITMIVAPILGPTLGGLITDNVSWRWIFYINIPIGIFSAFMVWRLVHDAKEHLARGLKNIDYIGLGLVTIGFAALQIVLDKGQQDDWFTSPFIMAASILSFIALGVAIIWLWGKKEPIIDLSLFKIWSFASACILIFFTGFVLYGSSALLPLLVQSVYGYDATLAGLVISPGGFMVLILMPVAGKLIGRVEARYLAVIGLSLTAFGMYYSTKITPQNDFYAFVEMRIFQILGLPFLFIPLSTLAFSMIPKEKSNKASALFALFRNIGGSVGIALTTTWVARHQQADQLNLAAHLTPGNLAYEHLVRQIEGHTHNFKLATTMIYQMLQKQSAIIAYGQAFGLLASIMAITAIASLFLLPANKPANQQASSLH